MKVTFSAIKADVGSIGGHTRPSERMLSHTKKLVDEQKGRLLIDGMVTHTGDDIALLMTHTKGANHRDIHLFAWNCFMEATEIAREEGCYGAGQDLLVDAPSGNVRGAGPGVAEIEFDRDNNSDYRPAESLLVFAADKCAPGAFNLPLYLAFCDPMHNGGLLLNPRMHLGYTITVIDMDYKGENGDGDRVIRLDVPERIWDLAALLQNMDRYAIESIHSRYKPNEQVVAVAATRLHNVAGKYTGKDDPICVFRTQGIFPAPEEASHPYLITHYVTGDARGSHVMPLMPVPVNTAVVGPYCHPLISCIGLSVDAAGRFSHGMVDMFDSPVWDEARGRSQVKALDMRQQGFFGAAMAGVTEMAYTGLVDTHNALEREFAIRTSSNGVTAAAAVH
jgi:fructose 1,6-bisphosphate aldolase/phosphatase